MKNALVLVAALALCLAPAVRATEVEGTNQFVIELAGAGPLDLAVAVEAAGGNLSWVDEDFGYGAAVSDDPKFAKNLKKTQGVKKVTRDLMVQWRPSAEDLGLEAVEMPVSQAPPPNPPQGAAFYACQWHLPQIDAPGAWAKGEFGDASVKVAVLDGGVDPFHIDLAGKVDLAQSISLLSQPSICDTVVPDQGTFRDFDFHGSFVAAEIASNGIGVAGVAPNATIVGVKVLSCLGSGTFGDVIAGILYSANLPDVEVINMSLGAYFPKNSPGAGPLVAALNKAVNYAQGVRGKLVVSSAGNDGVDLDHDGNFIHVPSQSGSGVSAWAGDINGGLASYSNHGHSGADVGAGGGDSTLIAPLPGCPINPVCHSFITSVCSTTSLFFNCGSGANYLICGAGTSFSAPLVAGVGALVDGKHLGSLNGGQLKSILKNTADDIGKKGADNLFSHGRVNAANAVD